MLLRPPNVEQKLALSGCEAICEPSFWAGFDRGVWPQVHYVTLTDYDRTYTCPVIFSPQTLALLNIFTAPWRARFAVVAVLSLIGLVIFSLWRKKFKIDYYNWRIWHGILSVVAVGAALVHVEMAGYYVSTPLKKALWIVYAVFWIGLLVYTRLIKPWWLIKHPYRVMEVKEERGNTWSLIVEPVGHKGIRFHPGQFRCRRVHRVLPQAVHAGR